MVTETMINEAYENLLTALEDYQEFAESAVRTKTQIEKDKITLLVSGVIDGRNAEIREAQVRQELAPLYKSLEELEIHERGTKDALDLMRIEVERVRLLVRLQEIVKE